MVPTPSGVAAGPRNLQGDFYSGDSALNSRRTPPSPQSKTKGHPVSEVPFRLQPVVLLGHGRLDGRRRAQRADLRRRRIARRMMAGTAGERRSGTDRDDKGYGTNGRKNASVHVSLLQVIFEPRC
jgi:hypothetical protein